VLLEERILFVDTECNAAPSLLGRYTGYQEHIRVIGINCWLFKPNEPLAVSGCYYFLK